MSPAVKLEEGGRVSVSFAAIGALVVLLVALSGAAGWLFSTGSAKGEAIGRFLGVEQRVATLETREATTDKRIAVGTEEAAVLRLAIAVNTQRLKYLEEALPRIERKLDNLFDRLPGTDRSKDK